MSLQQNVACTVTVKLDTGSSNALETWCESIDGISIREQLFKEPIHSDSNGGTAGPPVDVLLHGEVHTITFQSVRFDPAVDAKLQYAYGATAGNATANCVLAFADSKTYRVLLTGTNFTRNYLRVMVEDKELGRIGSHASVRQITLTCYANASGVLWNTTTS